MELSIGEFAGACGLSVPALRRYGEAGLLVPARVDESTGYRRYDVTQVPSGVLVRSLRELDVPLATVARIVEEHDPAAQLARLDRHWREVERSLLRGRAARDHLARLLGGWQDLVAEHVVTSRPVDELPVLLRRRRISLRDVQPHVDEAVGLLRERADSEGLQVRGVPVSLYPWPDDRLVDDTERAVEVCLPVRDTERADAVLPGGLLLFTEAEGARAGYPQVLAAYGAVSQWAHQHDRPLTDPPLMVHLTPEQVLVGWRVPLERVRAQP